MKTLFKETWKKKRWISQIIDKFLDKIFCSAKNLIAIAIME